MRKLLPAIAAVLMMPAMAATFALLMPIPDAAPVPAPAATSITDPTTIAMVCDSMCWGDQASEFSGPRRQLSRDLTAAGVAHRFETTSAPGQDCRFFADRMATILASKPDIVIIMCGKNDAGYGRPAAHTRAALRSIAGQALNAVPRPALYFASLSYSDPVFRNDWPVVDREAYVNNEIWDVTHTAYPYLTAFIDLTAVPGDGSHVQRDGVHYTRRGEDAVGRELFRQWVHAYLGVPSLPSFCGMYGRWHGNPQPAAFTPCASDPNAGPDAF